MTPEEQAHALAVDGLRPSVERRRHLSWVRIGGVLVVCGAIAAALVGFRSASHRPDAIVVPSSFAPYVDVTATPQFGFEDPTQSAASNVVLGFVVSTPTSACQPSWGASYSLSSAGGTLDLDRRIARLRQRGGQASISFGGADNSELAIQCTDPTALTAAYKSVVDRYSATSIDLDIEGDAASAGAVDARRATAIADLVTAEHAAGHTLAVWLTLPVSPSGLTSTGQAVLDAMLAAKVPITGVNALTMDYGIAVPAGQTMADLAESSLTALQRQLVSSYAKAGTTLSVDAAWSRIGATPMIGQNDTVPERFSLADATTLLAFARSHHLLRLSMWSLNRDRDCGPNYANVEVVSPNCSGVSQSTNAFTAVFEPFTRVVPAASSSTASPSATPSPAPTGPDDPATSPYQIWNPSSAYPAGTKVVWHHNVYVSKWYTQGDVPDAPVSAASATPWTLIGPVLPGDHPAATPTLPAGTYPTWSATAIYVGGDRVLYNGVGYQAKYWTQGNVPPPPGVSLAPSVNDPWQLLTSS
jgi:chitinase